MPKNSWQQDSMKTWKQESSQHVPGTWKISVVVPSMGALIEETGDFPGGPVAKTRSSQVKWPKSDQGTRSHTLQLNILHSQIYAYTHTHTHTHTHILTHAFPVALVVKSPPAKARDTVTWFLSLGQEDPLGEGTVTHSSTLAWRIPWTEEPGGLTEVT